MRKPLKIRPAQARDVPALQDIFNQESNLDKLEAYSDQKLADAIQNSENLFLVATYGGALECFVWVTGLSDTGRGPKIEEFASRLPGGGCGSYLFRHTVEKLLHSRHEKIWLAVAADNLKAVKFYQKFGFAEKQLRKAAWSRRSGDIADGLLMEAKIANFYDRRD